MNELKESLSRVKASEQLKSNTLQYLLEERNKIELKSHGAKYFYVIGVICACMILIIGIGGYSIYSRPVAYISIDVNPSIELQINMLNQVIGVTAYNDDGQKVIDYINLKNMSYTKAINKLLSDKTYQTYIHKDSALVFTIIADNFKKLSEEIVNCGEYKNYNAVIQISDKECMSEAHRNQMSFGKYSAYLELAQYDKDITVEECHKMTMGEICDKIGRCHEQNNNQNNGTGNNAGGSFGGKGEHPHNGGHHNKRH